MNSNNKAEWKEIIKKSQSRKPSRKVQKTAKQIVEKQMKAFEELAKE